MHPFSVGDIVICINDTPVPDRERQPGDIWPVVGRAYRVASIGTDTAGNHGISLAEVPNTPGSQGWHVWRFRKIERAADEFVGLLGRIGQSVDLREDVKAIVALRKRFWATPIPGNANAIRAISLENLLLNYSAWHVREFAHCPTPMHLRAVADLAMFWRDPTNAQAIGSYPWVKEADFPTIRLTANALAASRAAAPEPIFQDAVYAVSSRCISTWVTYPKFKQGRVMHLRNLLFGYGAWFYEEFGRYPEEGHLRLIADRMLTWRAEPTETIRGFNPWVVVSDYPDLCRAVFPTFSMMPRA